MTDYSAKADRIAKRLDRHGFTAYLLFTSETFNEVTGEVTDPQDTSISVHALRGKDSTVLIAATGTMSSFPREPEVGDCLEIDGEALRVVDVEKCNPGNVTLYYRLTLPSEAGGS